MLYHSSDCREKEYVWKGTSVINYNLYVNTNDTRISKRTAFSVVQWILLTQQSGIEMKITTTRKKTLNFFEQKRQQHYLISIGCLRHSHTSNCLTLFCVQSFFVAFDSLIFALGSNNFAAKWNEERILMLILLTLNSCWMRFRSALMRSFRLLFRHVYLLVSDRTCLAGTMPYWLKRIT